MRARTSVLALALCTALTVAGCARTSTPGTGAVNAPDKIVHVFGTNLNQVVLSPVSAGRLGISTQPVRQLPGSGANVVPVSAVLYEQDGSTWVYTNPTPFTYIRHAVVLGPIDDNQWVLNSGPAPGTAVVTVGGAELLGVEQGVEGE